MLLTELSLLLQLFLGRWGFGPALGVLTLGYVGVSDVCVEVALTVRTLLLGGLVHRRGDLGGQISDLGALFSDIETRVFLNRLDLLGDLHGLFESFPFNAPLGLLVLSRVSLGLAKRVELGKLTQNYSRTRLFIGVVAVDR